MERGRAACGGLFERPFVSWRDDVALFLGPRLAGYSKPGTVDSVMSRPLCFYPLTAPPASAATVFYRVEIIASLNLATGNATFDP
jgi:hypothetical protein